MQTDKKGYLGDVAGGTIVNFTTKTLMAGAALWCLAPFLKSLNMQNITGAAIGIGLGLTYEKNRKMAGIRRRRYMTWKVPVLQSLMTGTSGIVLTNALYYCSDRCIDITAFSFNIGAAVGFGGVSLANLKHTCSEQQQEALRRSRSLSRF